MIFENKITYYKKEVVFTLKYTYIRLDSANRLPEMPKKVVGNPSAGAKQSGLDLWDQSSSFKKNHCTISSA